MDSGFVPQPKVQCHWLKFAFKYIMWLEVSPMAHPQWPRTIICFNFYSVKHRTIFITERIQVTDLGNCSHWMKTHVTSSLRVFQSHNFLLSKQHMTKPLQWPHYLTINHMWWMDGLLKLKFALYPWFWGFVCSCQLIQGENACFLTSLYTFEL